MTNDMPEQPTPVRAPTRRIPLAIGAVLVGGAIGFAAIHGIGGLKRSTAGDPACRAAVDTAQRIAALAHGEVAALTMAATPLQLPDLAFEDADGKAKKLSDWRGKTVLVNLWATWCVPCRKEMPALDRLQGEINAKEFAIVAVNIDTGDPAKPHRYLSEVGIKNLAYYDDPSTNVFQELKRVGRAVGLPTSILIDRGGCEIGYLAGPAEWSSEEAIALVRSALAQ
jgi:thiol-disulfide isomerase/thioredoxin